jgi:hypothetical protein
MLIGFLLNSEYELSDKRKFCKNLFSDIRPLLNDENVFVW